MYKRLKFRPEYFTFYGRSYKFTFKFSVPSCPSNKAHFFPCLITTCSLRTVSYAAEKQENTRGCCDAASSNLPERTYTLSYRYIHEYMTINWTSCCKRNSMRYEDDRADQEHKTSMEIDSNTKRKWELKSTAFVRMRSYIWRVFFSAATKIKLYR